MTAEDGCGPNDQGPEGERRALGASRWLLGAAGLLVPKDRRAEWRAEWDAEVCHHLRQEGPGARPRRLALARCLGAFRHALWLRAAEWKIDWRKGMKMTGLWNDVRHTLRGFARAPMFTVTTVVTLALGVGALGAIFTVVNGVLLEPLPFEDEGELVSVYHTAPGWGFHRTPVALQQWATYRTQSRVFESLAAWTHGGVTVTERGDPERMWSMNATWELFPVLGVEPALGRSFSPGDDSPDGAETVMLSYGYWQRAFGESPDAVGATLVVDGVTRTVIGVLPEEFEAPQQDVQIVLPFRWNRERIIPTGFNYEVVARLMEPTPQRVLRARNGVASGSGCSTGLPRTRGLASRSRSGPPANERPDLTEEGVGLPPAALLRGAEQRIELGP